MIRSPVVDIAIASGVIGLAADAGAQTNGTSPLGIEAVPGTRTLLIQRVTQAPTLNDLAEPPFPQSVVVDDFRQNQPADGAPTTQPTTAYLSYDEDNLYVIFDCVDDVRRVRARLAKREDIADDDQVIVYLDTFHDHRRAYQFAVNPLGVQRDGIATEGQDTDYGYDTVWRSEARLTDGGFMVLMAIPFKSLRFSNADTQTWGIALGR